MALNIIAIPRGLFPLLYFQIKIRVSTFKITFQSLIEFERILACILTFFLLAELNLFFLCIGALSKRDISVFLCSKTVSEARVVREGKFLQCNILTFSVHLLD